MNFGANTPHVLKNVGVAHVERERERGEGFSQGRQVRLCCVLVLFARKSARAWDGCWSARCRARFWRAVLRAVPSANPRVFGGQQGAGAAAAAAGWERCTGDGAAVVGDRPRAADRQQVRRLPPWRESSPARSSACAGK